MTNLAKLRAPFPENQISYLPKGGVKLAYVGHAALTDRLLDVDPNWTWEPLAYGPDGLPAIDESGGLWIKLTVCGVTRLGYGDAQGKTGGNAMKERIGDALRTIQYGDADVMFAGGTEAAVAKTPMAGFAAMKALSSRDCPPEEASCPFDIRRDGFVLSEGSGVLILEELEHAKNRGAHIYAEVIGYGTNGDAYHITAPRPDGELAARCMQKAIDDAGISPEDIDYINAHGTSTGLNDKNETKAIKKVLGKHAYDIVVNSTKSMTGHLLGAAGAVEAIVCVMSIMNNKVHQTLNLVTPDPECDLDYAPEGPRDMKVDVTMSNAFGFGGHNAVVILRRYEE